MIIDFHSHIFSPYFRKNREFLLAGDATLADLYSNPKARMASAEELVSTMDSCGIDVAVVLGIGWTDMEMCYLANQYIIDSCARFPTRLKGFCSINPLWGKDAVAEIERCADAGILGIGELHPDTQRFDMGDMAIMSPIVEIAMERGMPILTHTSEPVGHEYPGKGHTTPDVIWKFINNFPDVKLICAHWGGGLPFYQLMPEVANMTRNVFFDTAASPLLYNASIFSTVTRIMGSERILFGSDYPLIDQKRVIQQVVDSSITDDSKEDMLYANARRLLGI
jgi:predicted TIM-barrel fold metal-dependent hydrolase